MFGNTYMCAVA